jgi:hypothetical protein
LLSKYQPAFIPVYFSPTPDRQISQRETADLNPNQPQRGMPNRGAHSADLPILPLDQF